MPVTRAGQNNWTVCAALHMLRYPSIPAPFFSYFRFQPSSSEEGVNLGGHRAPVAPTDFTHSPPPQLWSPTSGSSRKAHAFCYLFVKDPQRTKHHEEKSSQLLSTFPHMPRFWLCTTRVVSSTRTKLGIVSRRSTEHSWAWHYLVHPRQTEVVPARWTYK